MTAAWTASPGMSPARAGGAGRRRVSPAARRPEDRGARQVLDLRLEGYTREEIAERLGCAERAVRRKLDVIREAWLQGES